jgi:hypothetical protein
MRAARRRPATGRRSESVAWPGNGHQESGEAR